ncbi:hypothetical protein K438DRAFT_1640163 [Mycena galopus ATCC 62051]|nr:hypothetical protein K438DRAFT_1640163 [Mycena galopus ATCC 62051]
MACPGITVSWPAGSHWSNDPWLQHDNRDLGWEPISFEADGRITFRSDTCKPSSNIGAPCRACQMLPDSALFRRMIGTAKEALPHTPWEYLTPKQMQDTMKRLAQRNKSLTSRVNHLKAVNVTAKRRISEHRRIMMMLAQNDIPGLRRILTVMARRGAGPNALIAILKRARDGLFNARGGFNNRDMDLSFLVKSIGGPKLLYALQKSHGLASVSTVKRNNKIPRLVTSIGAPTLEDINANIASFFDPEIKPPPLQRPGIALAGNILMLDGVSLETKCRYCPDRNSILGLCREHSHRVNTKVESLESVENVRNALFNGSEETKVCFGTEATVVAIAPYSETDHYTPVPIAVSPSDKTKKGHQLAKWIQTVLDAWAPNPHGEKMYGPIDAIGTDGDSGFRLAKHLLCMVKEVDPTSPLGQILHNLNGFNCFISKDGQRGTCDPKHIFKRDATMLRNFLGILVGDINITPSDIVTHLSALPDVSLEQAKQLLDPSDKQNVPKAVSLIQRLYSLENLPPPPNPVEFQTRKAITFFARVLSFFAFPFIKVEMSLSQQVESLATYAFLAAALQLRHGTGCMTGPIYSDSQAVVKNIIFVIAEMQLLDPDLRFYIILEGTDRLEVVFSDCRTQDHARNFDIEQLAGKLAVGALIHAAFQRNPELDRGHRRLSLRGALGIDHANPRSWEGDTRVGNVNLPMCWEAGEQAAGKIWQEYFGTPFDFKKQFATNGCDLLRPNGRYVVVHPSHDDKRSEEENSSPLFPVVSGSNITGDSEELNNNHQNSSSPVPPDGPPDEDHLPVISAQDFMLFEGEKQQEHSDMPLGMDLEDFFPDTDTIQTGPGHRNEQSGTVFSQYLEAEGKKYLKSSVVATLSSNRSRKATMRTLRVRGVALEDLRGRKSESLDLGDPDGDDFLKENDLVATLMRSGGEICLGVLVLKGFRIGKEVRTSITMAELEDPQKKVKAMGQIAELRNPPTGDQNPQPACFWEWTGNYLQVNFGSADELKTRNLFVVEVPGSLVFPLGPSLTKRTGGEEPTWSIPIEQLTEVLEEAWNSLDPDGKDISSNLMNLPELGNNKSIPYRNSFDEMSMVVKNVPEHLKQPKLSGKDTVTCLICGPDRKGATRQLRTMRSHVAMHILKSQRGVEEEGLAQSPGMDPCGFCGLDGCFTQLEIDSKKKKNPIVIKSSCRYHYSGMNYKSAKTASNSAPSTNVPIQCLLCPPSEISRDQPTIWKYNAISHIVCEHAIWDNKMPTIKPEFMAEIYIRKAEEAAMGIPAEDTADWRDRMTFPAVMLLTS